MSKYCQVKLVDVLKEKSREKTKMRNKTKNVGSFETKSTKAHIENLSCFMNRSKRLRNTTNNQMESREIRLTNKSPKPAQKKDSGTRSLKKTYGAKIENVSEKRKRSDNKVENEEEPPSKKIFIAGDNHKTLPDEPVKRTVQSKKSKRQPRDTCWENKLTGARRVSKRLSNLKIKKQKSSKELGTSSNALKIIIESKQPINLSARGSINIRRKINRKSNKKNKSANDQNNPEVQINFGKSIRTKSLYPKILTGRRPAKYTITVKPQNFIQQNSRMKRSSHDSSTENSLDVNVIKSSEDNENEAEKEPRNHEVSSGTDTTENNKTENFDETSKSDENTEEISTEIIPSHESTAENNSEAITLDEVHALVCESIDKELADNQKILILNIESGKNIQCGTSENQDNAQNSESESNQEEIKTAEIQHPDFEEQVVSEKVNIDQLSVEQVKSEEKIRSDESHNLNNQDDMTAEPETTGGNTTDGLLGESSFLTETIDITD